jgi:hypothetical protein
LELCDNGVGFQYLELGERDSYRQRRIGRGLLSCAG